MNDNLNKFKENEFIFKDYHEEIGKDIEKISYICEDIINIKNSLVNKK